MTKQKSPIVILDQYEIDRKKNIRILETLRNFYSQQKRKMIIRSIGAVLLLLVVSVIVLVGVKIYHDSNAIAIPSEGIVTQDDSFNYTPLATSIPQITIGCKLEETENSISVQATNGSWGYFIQFVTETDQLLNLKTLGQGPTINQQYESIAISATSEKATVFCVQNQIEIKLVENGLYYFVKNEYSHDYDAYLWIHEGKIRFIATDLVIETGLDPVDRRPSP